MNEENKNIIEVKDLEVVFAVRSRRMKNVNRTGLLRAVDKVTLDIRKGETIAIVGESGCGKTTLGKAIAHIVEPTAGRIIFDGVDLSQLSKGQMQVMREKIQLIFQDPYESLNPRQNIYKTLMEPLTIHRKGLGEKEKKDIINRYLEAVGLHSMENVLERYPHHLSGGQRQRLAIAAAMILEPKVVIADEPVSMLDVSVRAEILNLMLDLQKQKDLTYMFITHDLSLAWVIADRTAVFYLGKMMEIGSADVIIHGCRHPYSKALVSVIPSMGAKDQQKYVLFGETPSPMNIPSGCRFHTRCWLYEKMGRPEICREKEPEYKEVGEDHLVACHFENESDK
ncbi:MAG: ABC transporter ATP-binding protein [Anaerovoracaceae bacterium]